MATKSSIDSATAGAIREALAAAARGRLSDACSIGERALADGAEPAPLHAMLGMFHCRLGDLDRGAEHLRSAHRHRPDDVVVATNLANTLSQLGEHREALDVLSLRLARTDGSLQLMKLRGFLAQEVEEFELAVQAYEQVVAASPGDWETWNNLGNARRGAFDFEGSVDALGRAAKLQPTSAPVRLNLAVATGAAGNLAEAEAQLRQMAADFPDDPQPLMELHSLLKEQNRDEEALGAIEAAVERVPGDIQLLLGLASHLSAMVRSADAEVAYRRVLELDEDNALAHLGLAVVLDLMNRTEELSALASQAEARGVGPNALNFIRAYDHRRAKRFAEGLAAMEQVPSDLETARRLHLLGQLLEGVGRYDEAFEAFSKMNELQVEEARQPVERAAGYRNLIRGRRESMTEEWVRSWRSETAPDPRPTPVFLMGFPRSGTTLLDTMLMGHPSIEVLEEEPTLHTAYPYIPNFDDLPTATDEQIQGARNAYFETAARKTPLKPGNLLIDKNPLATNAVPFIRRIFPEARIILAVRHPCDVVLSCYVTNFKLNDGMANFVALETAAELYDLTFSYFERAQELMPTPTHVVVYERVVQDQQHELGALFEFLGLEWHDAVLDHRSTALSRGRIKTASYAQVAEPLYTRSSGRWLNYRKHLEPVIPILRPWIEKFGYEV